MEWNAHDEKIKTLTAVLIKTRKEALEDAAQLVGMQMKDVHEASRISKMILDLIDKEEG